MRFNWIIIGIVFLGFNALIGCSNSEEEVAISSPVEEIAQEPSTDLVYLQKAQMEVMKMKLGSFSQMNLTNTVKTNGQLELPPQNKASMSSVMAGRVKEVRVIEGVSVRKGQVLAVLENSDVIDLQQDYLSKKNEFEYLEHNYKRKEKLYQDSIGSEKEYEKVRAEYKSAKAVLGGYEAKLKLLNFTHSEMNDEVISSTFNVISPIDGFVRLIEINIGSFVQPQEEMFEIVDNDHIHMDLMVFEKDVDKVKKGQKVMFSISAHPENIFHGEVFSVGKAFERELKAVRVHAEITSKPTGLLPGMYVSARIIIDSNTVLSVPNSAIITQNGISYIFVVNKEKSNDNQIAFNRVEVNRGDEDMGFVGVLPSHSIPENSQIVVFGAYYVMAQMNKELGE